MRMADHARHTRPSCPILPHFRHNHVHVCTILYVFHEHYVHTTIVFILYPNSSAMPRTTTGVITKGCRASGHEKSHNLERDLRASPESWLKNGCKNAVYFPPVSVNCCYQRRPPAPPARTFLVLETDHPRLLSDLDPRTKLQQLSTERTGGGRDFLSP